VGIPSLLAEPILNGATTEEDIMPRAYSTHSTNSANKRIVPHPGFVPGFPELQRKCM